MSIFTKLGVNVAAPFDADGTPRQISPQDFQIWMTEVERLIKGLLANAGGVELPELIYKYVITGGDANKIIAKPNAEVTAGVGEALFTIDIAQPNTGNVSINGKPLLTSSGNQIVAAGLVTGIWLFLDEGANFRLVSDQASQAIMTAVENALLASKTAQQAAEDARDTAAGFASDVVSQGNVPIYATLASIASLEIPAGINAIRVNGRNALGDGGGGLYISIDNGSTDKGTSGGVTTRSWYRVEDGVSSRVSTSHYVRNLGYIVGGMAAGKTVKFACFGDSTTDGNTTTGWTANPTLGGNAEGLIDHEATAPNAWPAKLQALLRSMFGHSNIHVYNAGYSGKRLDDGWAVQNYKRAVIDNPFYGSVDATFIAFGINDVANNSTSVLDDHVRELRKLVAEILRLGSLPILLSSDATRVGSSAVNTRRQDISRQLDIVKELISIEFGIPYWDLNRAMQDWWALNNDNRNWAEIQTDSVHVGDLGHAFKAGFIASKLFRDTLYVSQGKVERPAVSDTRALALSPSYTTNGAKPGMRGRWNNNTTVGTYPVSSEIMTAWIWNEAPEATLIYRSLSQEGIVDFTNASRIKVLDTISGEVIFNEKSPNTGMYFSATQRSADRANILCKLPYGLSKVALISPPVNDFAWSFGYFEVNPTTPFGTRKSDCFIRSTSVNALKHTGPLFFKGRSGVELFRSEEAPDLSNVISLLVGRPVSLLIEGKFNRGMGLGIMGGKRWEQGNAGIAEAAATGLMLFFGPVNLGAYVYNLSSSGEVGFNGPLGGINGAFNTDTETRLKVTLERHVNGQISMAYWSDWAEQSLVASGVLDTSTGEYASAGYFGDIFSNASVHGSADGTLEISSAVFRYN